MFPVNIKKPFLFLKICCVQHYWHNWNVETTCSIGINDTLVIGEKSKCGEVRGSANFPGRPSPMDSLSPHWHTNGHTNGHRQIQAQMAAQLCAGPGCGPTYSSLDDVSPLPPEFAEMPEKRFSSEFPPSGFPKHAPVGVGMGVGGRRSPSHHQSPVGSSVCSGPGL